jgi:hypothetical protein
VAVPEATPPTTPVPDITVATLVLLLVHVPPPVLLVKVVELPTHMLVEPAIAAGLAVTVTVAVTRQPEIEYVIIEVPVATPQKLPVPAIVATAGLLLDQVPPEAELLSNEQSPIQTSFVPVIAPGHKTVTVVVV